MQITGVEKLIFKMATESPDSHVNISKDNKGSVIYLSTTGLFFLILFVIFIFLPRPEYSELEKRDLETFPEFSEYKDNLPGYTAGISQWFSNTQPFRDDFLTLSMGLRNAIKLSNRSDAVSFIGTADSMEESLEQNDEINNNETDPKTLIEENAKVANAGIIVAGNSPTARAMMVFGGSKNSGGKFISTVNNYASELPDVNIYSVIASSSGDFYMPEKVKNRNHPETPTLEHIKAELLPSVRFVDVHEALAKHANEDIFLRTDHHWAPLGAYYAAEALAKSANVPFRSLDSYDKHVIHDFVGSMYGYSKDINVKNSPEDFVYYTPKGIDYKTTFTTYYTDKEYRVTGTSKPYESTYFKSFKDGSGSAYLTFMGGDQHLVHVKTDSNSPRKILIIKDSFGNALPGYLFYSFSDIHIVDFRYFNKNMKKYVKENGITDIAFVFNIFNVCNSNTFSKVNRFLTQNDGEIFRESKNSENEKIVPENLTPPLEENNTEESPSVPDTNPSPEIEEPTNISQPPTEPEIPVSPEPLPGESNIRG